MATRTTNKTTTPSYKTYTSKSGEKTEVSNNNGKVTTKVTQKGGGYAIRVVEGNKTSYRTFDKSGRETTGKSTTGNNTQSKVTTSKLTQDQKDVIPMKNSTIDKFSEKVYPIYQTPTAKNRRENTLNFAADAENNKKPFKQQEILYGSREQRDSSLVSVNKMNLKNFSGVMLPVYPDKNNPYVPPKNTGAGPLVKRTFNENNAQLRANKRLTGKTGDERR
jgi:hypothetical protein